MQTHNCEVVITPQYTIGAGIDCHKDIMVVHISSKDGQKSETLEFKTFTDDLETLTEYLVKEKVEVVLMESTGVYWISLYHKLIGAKLNVIVANPQHIKQMPKRKTDRKDAKWLCTLAINGLVRKSFVPDGVHYSFREYCRIRDNYRKRITQLNNRMVKILERSNIKLRSVSSSIRTKTCQLIIGSILNGITDPAQLSALCLGKLKNKKEEIEKAVKGTISEGDQIILRLLQEDRDHAQKQLDSVNEKILEMEQAHYTLEVKLLDEISGIGQLTAQQIIAEIGTDMDKFETADQLTSWAGLAPGNNESAGKKKSTSTKKGNKYLRTAMVTAAWAAARSKKTYWFFLFSYLKRKMSAKKAIIAIARRMLKVVFKVLKEKIHYVEGGKELFDHYQHARLAKQVDKSTIKAA